MVGVRNKGSTAISSQEITVKQDDNGMTGGHRSTQVANSTQIARRGARK